MRKFKILIGILTLLFSTLSNAALVRLDFEGQISSAGSFLDPTGLFSQGDAISGFWEFESTTADSDASSTRGSYSQFDSLTSFQINIGSYFFQTDTYNIQILDDHVLGIGTIDAYDVLGGDAISNIDNLILSQIQFTIRDTVAPLDALSSDALFETAPDLSAFDQVNQSQGQIVGRYGDEQNLLFMNLELNSITTASVPEPSMIALMGAGLAGLGIARRRKKRA